VGTLVAALSGLLTAASFLDLGGVFVWGGLVPLLLVLRSRSVRAAFALGWVAGAVFFGATTYWVVTVLDRYTRLPGFAVAGVFALMTAVLGCYWGAFSACLVRLRASGLPQVWLAPAIWVALEWLRGWFVIGFPWAILGTSQHRLLPLIQVSEVTGVYGVSALVVFANVVVAELVAGEIPRRTRVAAAAALAALLATAVLGGEWRIRTVRESVAAGALEVAIVQGNVDEERKWDPELRQDRAVPFGEAVPYANILFFVDRIVPSARTLVPGSQPAVLRLQDAAFGVLICYEGVFAELARRFVADGADFLVNVSNDAWFGRSVALRQHLAQVAFRAVENRVPIVRATNTGISAFIDADGSIRWEGPIGEALWHVETIRWPGVRTFYTRFGNVFAWLCVTVTLGALALAARRARARRSTAAE
jgi:apolipoprotein N-acyltransferase